jgi:Zn-finger nucleic acid-binding protein
MQSSTVKHSRATYDGAGHELRNCTQCGAPQTRLARSCEHCRAPLASVTCACCFHANTHLGQHCTACGERLGLEPQELSGSESCPRCAGRMRRVDALGHALLDCQQCGGQFVGEHTLLALLVGAGPVREPSENEPVLFVAGPELTQAATFEAVMYLRCPFCDKCMNRKNFAADSGIVLDVCSQHGAFCDAGELPKVLRYGRERADAARAVAELFPKRGVPVTAAGLALGGDPRDLPRDVAEVDTLGPFWLFALEEIMDSLF